jgi:FAD/FMN-containing dehydrogenase
MPLTNDALTPLHLALNTARPTVRALLASQASGDLDSPEVLTLLDALPLPYVAEGVGLPLWRPVSPQALALCLLWAAQAGVNVVGAWPDVAQLTNEASSPLAVYMDVSALNACVAHDVDDLVITTQTGMSLGELQHLLYQQGQWLPWDAPPQALLSELLMTLAPTLAQGLKRGLPESVLGLTVALANGTLAKCGGKVVKNVTGYDLQKFYLGTRYQLAHPTQVSLRLMAYPQQATWCVVQAPTLASLQAFTQQVLALPSVTLSALNTLPAHHAQALGLPLVDADNLPSDAWCGYVRVMGLPTLVSPALEQLGKWADAHGLLHTTQPSQHPLHTDTVAQTLGQWACPWRATTSPFSLNTTLVALMACPFGAEITTLEAMQAHWPVAPTVVQVQPASAWVVLVWPAETLTTTAAEAWQTLHQHAHQHDAVLTALHAPPQLAKAVGQWQHPTDSALTALNTQLKHQFDPKGCLL